MSRAIEVMRSWRVSPIKFVQDNFKTEPDAWQREVLIAYGNRDQRSLKILLKAAVGVGKSSVLSWCGWHFLACFGDQNDVPKGICLSITRENLKANLWSEFSKWQQKSEFLTAKFTWTASRIYCNESPSTWFLEARGYAQTSNEEDLGKTLSGLHSQYVLVLIDEGGNINPAILKAAEQALGNCTFGRILVAGNPTSHDGLLYFAAVTHRKEWHVVTITSNPDDPNRSPRVDIEWARSQIAQYGPRDSWVLSSIMGEFPESNINSLLSVAEVESAMSRSHRVEEYDWVQKRIGIDVARFGLDRTVLFPRQGLQAFKPVIMRSARTNEIGARALTAKNKWGYELEFIDDTGGFGSGVVDWLITAGSNPQAVNFSSKATNPRYYNKRAEMYFEMAAWIKRGGSLPNDPELVTEITSPTYSFKDGKLIIEAKDQIKQRIGTSPDKVDALVLTFALPDVPATTSIPGFSLSADGMYTHNSKAYEYDPFKDL